MIINFFFSFLSSSQLLFLIFFSSFFFLLFILSCIFVGVHTTAGILRCVFGLVTLLSMSAVNGTPLDTSPIGEICRKKRKKEETKRKKIINNCV